MNGRALAHTLALLRFRMRSNDEARAEIRAPEVRCIRLGCGARAAERSSSSKSRSAAVAPLRLEGLRVHLVKSVGCPSPHAQ